VHVPTCQQLLTGRLCAAAFKPYREQFLTRPSSAFVGWHVDLWARLASMTGMSDYAQFVFEQTDWLLKMQKTDQSAGEWLGGFAKGHEAPKFSSLVFLEAVVRAYSTAKSVGDKDRSDKYKNAIRAGLSFCGRLRLAALPSTWFPNPSRCVGGVSCGLLDRRVRCDIPQHLITLCLSVLENADNLL
jgi:hypothetical protein